MPNSNSPIYINIQKKHIKKVGKIEKNEENFHNLAGVWDT